MRSSSQDFPEEFRQKQHASGSMSLASNCKGIFFDGHERDDVVAERKSFLDEMAKVGFLHPDHAPNQKRLVLSCHQFLYLQTVMWGKKGEHMLRPKSKGSGIMLSDFIDEHCGFLALTDEEFAEAQVTCPDQKQHACQFLEYGGSREGYWTNAKFMAQMEVATSIAEVNIPGRRGGGWSGYLIKAAATRQWLTMHLTRAE